MSSRVPDPIKRRCAACRDGRELPFAITMAFQPIVDFHAETVYGYEALVRGANGDSAATVLARVNDDNRYAFDQACRVSALRLATQLGLATRLSINFLPNAIYKPELCIRTTLQAAQTFGFPLERIIFEVTEGERVEDGPWFAQILREYQQCGFKTAIDDFGAGYAGLKLLAEFQPDMIKIDMDLVRNIEQSRARQAIVKSLVALCADMQIEVIAEGIETVAERDCLSDAGIHLMQGYLFAKPAFQSIAAVSSTALKRA